MPARRVTKKAVYRIRNWGHYNEALVGVWQRFATNWAIRF